MSKRINVQSGHYKVAGRGRQGEDILQEQQKRAFVTQRESARVEGIEAQAGLPAWEVTPPNLETEEPPAAPAKKSRKRAKPAKRKAARARKASAGRVTGRRRQPMRKRPARRAAVKSAKRRSST